MLRDVDEVAAVEVVRQRLWTDRRDVTGPFDIVGDMHGCHTELVALLAELGWVVDTAGTRAHHPAGRMAVFLGDLVDRGPASTAVLRLVMNMVADGVALCVPGNHEHKLTRALDGRNVRCSHGLAETMAQLDGESAEFHAEVHRFIDGLVSHAVLDGGSLVVAHAGLPAAMHGRSSAAVRAFSLYGDTTGDRRVRAAGALPVADDYRGAPRSSTATRRCRRRAG